MTLTDVNEISNFQFGELIFKHTNNCLPEFLSNYFTDISQVHNYNIMLYITMLLPRQTLNYEKVSTKFRRCQDSGMIYLLRLSKNTCSLTFFKKNYKTYLINSHN